jgi:hypothetical protein
MTLMMLSSEAPLLRLQLLGYMHFPGDERMRDALILTATSRAASKAKHTMVLSPDEAGVLSDSPGYDGLRELIPKAAQQGGIIAGETLIALLGMHVSNIEPSLGKAQYLLSQDIPRRKRASDGRLPSSDRSLRNAWAEFRCVAHFWAALQLSRENKMRECDFAEYPSAFLSLAVAVFDMVTNVTRNQPLFDADTWLPAPGISPLSVSISPLADRQIAFLKNYSPRARN